MFRLTQSADRKRAGALYRERGVQKQIEGDFLLCTLPCPVLSRIDVQPEFSGPKWRAIRELNYDSSTKVLAVARRRFWESDDGIYGGGTFTDLPLATAYYPSDNAEARDARVSAGPGVLLASYSWGQTARRLASLDHTARAGRRAAASRRACIRSSRKPGIMRETRSWSWDNHPLSSGAFAWFLPGQHTELHAALVAPEGRIFFAGEHASLTHTWMQGALESGLRATREMLEARDDACATIRSRPRSRPAGARTARWCSNSSRRALPQICRNAGAEFVLFDMEHTGLSFETLKMQFALCRGLDIVPMVRVPRGEYHFIARALDVGAMGIMVPMVGTAEEAAHIVVVHALSAGRPARRGVRLRARRLPGRRRRGQDGRAARTHDGDPADRDRRRPAQRRGDRRGARRRRAVAGTLRPDQFHGHPRRSSSIRITLRPSRASSPRATRTARRPRSSRWTTTGRAITSPRASG